MALHVILSTHPTGAGVPHKVQVQAATVAGLGKSRVVKEVLFSEEEGTVSYKGIPLYIMGYCLHASLHTHIQLPATRVNRV